jgi:hypothetical protein
VLECLPAFWLGRFSWFRSDEHLGQRWLPSSAWLGIRVRRAGSVAELAGTRAVRLDADCDLCYYGPADCDPRRRGAWSAPRRRASGFAVVLLVVLGVALILAGFRVDVPMLSGGTPATWNGWVHGIAFLLIIATGVLAPLTMALAVRRDPGWRPIALVSVAASALVAVFLFLPWGNATFLLAIVTLFGWIAALAARLATHHS